MRFCQENVDRAEKHGARDEWPYLNLNVRCSDRRRSGPVYCKHNAGRSPSRNGDQWIVTGHTEGLSLRNRAKNALREPKTDIAGATDDLPSSPPAGDLRFLKQHPCSETEEIHGGGHGDFSPINVLIWIMQENLILRFAPC